MTAAQEEVEEIETGVGEVNEAVRVLSQKVAMMAKDIGELSLVVEDLTRANRCLERASDQQTLLGERHYEDHVIAPLVNAVLSLIHLMDQCQPRESDPPEAVLGQLRQVQRAIRGGLEQLLFLYGVEMLRSEPNTEFNPRTMRAAQTVVTDDEGLDHRVARSLRCGMRRGRRVLRCELVTVYRCQQKAIRPGEAASPGKVARNLLEGRGCHE